MWRQIGTGVLTWLRSTIALAALMLGFGIALFQIAAPTSNWLLSKYAIRDDWSVMALPVGCLVGVALGVRYRRRLWLEVLAFSLLLFSISVFVHAWMPIEAPPSTPKGMNRLPVSLGNAIRVHLLHVHLLAAGCCILSAGMINGGLIVFDAWRQRAGRFSRPRR